jgi:hypothetical protein
MPLSSQHALDAIVPISTSANAHLSAPCWWSNGRKPKDRHRIGFMDASRPMVLHIRRNQVIYFVAGGAGIAEPFRCRAKTIWSKPFSAGGDARC